MASSKPSVVVVMGSFQLPWQYRYLKASLEKRDYNTKVVNLASTVLDGSTIIPDSLLKDIEVVRKAVMEDINEGRDVVVLAHSQGGVATSVALEGLGKTGTKPGVTHVVFLACWLVEPGITGRQKSGGGLPDWLEDRDGLQIIRGNAKSILYNDVPDLLADDAANFIFPNCSNVNDTIIPYVAWKDIPSTYVICEKDCALFPPVQEWVISSCQLPSEILRLDTGHSPFLSMPEVVAAIVRNAAGEKEVDMTGVKLGLIPKSGSGAEARDSKNVFQSA